MHRITWVEIVLLVAAAAVRLLVPFRQGIDLPSRANIISLNIVVFWLLVLAAVGALVGDLAIRFWQS